MTSSLFLIDFRVISYGFNETIMALRIYVCVKQDLAFHALNSLSIGIRVC